METQPGGGKVASSTAAATSEKVEGENKEMLGKSPPRVKAPSGPPFTLKKWNAVAMWQWDVECDTCAICRVQVMGESRNHAKCISLYCVC